MPFSAVWIRYSRVRVARLGSVTLNPPTSPTASVQPSNRSGWLSTRHRAPVTPAGLLVGDERDDHVARRPRHRCAPHCRTTTAASRPCPSCRPRRGPRRSRPGSRRRTGRPSSRRGRPGRRRGGRAAAAPAATGRSPSIRRDHGGPARLRLVQPGLDPDLVELPATYSAAARSPGPELVAVVGRVDPDQVAAELHDLVLGVRRSMSYLSYHSGPGWDASPPGRVKLRRAHRSGWRNGRRASLRC